MKIYARWLLLSSLVAASLAQSQNSNYFPPPGIAYTQGGGLVLGTATGGGKGVGTLNAQNLYLNGVAVSSANGTVTSVTVQPANGLSGAVATPTTTPTITLAPTFSGIAYSNGAAFSAAVAANFPTFNQNTTGNAATATLASTATALAGTPALCPGGQVAQGILANGNSTGCSAIFSIINEPANAGFFGPTSGAAALPTFRTLVANDLPLTSAPTWIGNTTFTPISGVGVTINGTGSAHSIDINNGTNEYASILGANATGQSFGLLVQSGTNTTDLAVNVTDRANTVNFFRVYGDGSAIVGGPAGGFKGIGTLNAVTLYQNGNALVASATTDTTNASNISSGTLADARLSANIPLLNGGSNFTVAPTISSSQILTLASGGNITTAPTISGATIATTSGVGSVTTVYVSSTGNVGASSAIAAAIPVVSGGIYQLEFSSSFVTSGGAGSFSSSITGDQAGAITLEGAAGVGTSAGQTGGWYDEIDSNNNSVTSRFGNAAGQTAQTLPTATTGQMKARGIFLTSGNTSVTFHGGTTGGSLAFTGASIILTRLQ